MSTADDCKYVDVNISDVYRQIANAMQQAAIGAAAGVLVAILARFSGLSDRIPYLVVTLLYAQVPVATYRRGARISFPPFTASDQVCPVGMAITNVALFLVLSTPSVPIDFRVWWWLLVAFNALGAVALVAARLECTNERTHRNWLSSDLYGAGVVTLGSLFISASVFDFGRFVLIGGVVVDYSVVAAYVLGVISVIISLRSIAQENELSAAERRVSNK